MRLSGKYYYQLDGILRCNVNRTWCWNETKKGRIDLLVSKNSREGKTLRWEMLVDTDGSMAIIIMCVDTDGIL
jgi:hypothetical protein